MKNKVTLQDKGRIRFEDAWKIQSSLLESMKEVKLGNRPKEQKDIQRHYFLFCEHEHVYTLGKSGSETHLLLNDSQRNSLDVEYFKINRGGDITYHGPGQIVGYPILDLDEFFTDVHKYVRFIEEMVICCLAEYGIIGERIEGFTGVWINKGDYFAKICAIGVHLSRWITMHGFAFNVNTDLAYFKHIIPCGIDAEDKEVTSMQKELGREIEIAEVKERLLRHFMDLFNCEIVHEST